MKESLQRIWLPSRINQLKRHRPSGVLQLAVCALLAIGLQVARAEPTTTGGVGPGANTLEKAFEVPTGPKILSFDAAAADDKTGNPTDTFQFKITDSSGKLLLTVTLKPKKKNPGDPESLSEWEVFYAIGDGPEQDTHGTIPAKQLTTFTTILTEKGVVFRFGPAGESFVFSSDPILPKDYDLQFTKLDVNFLRIAASTDPTSQDRGDTLTFKGFRTNEDLPGFLSRRTVEPHVIFPDKPGGSPP